MSRHLHVDAFAGIAGDMMVAALIHLGAPLDAVVAGVGALGVHGWKARTEQVFRGAYAATRFVVEPDSGAEGGHPPPQRLPPSLASFTPLGHGHSHDHDHGHGHDHEHGADEFPGQPSRAWRDIRGLIEAAALPPRAKARALSVFGRLAEAEGRVHGMPAEEVTFHEVGAVDSIVDIVGACVALELLEVDTVSCGPLPMGRGSVRSAHGILPVPVPATVEVLRGFPVVPGDGQGELVTPTGAALLAGIATPGTIPPMILRGVGYGAGTRNPATHANVLRVILGEGAAHSPTDVVELRAQVDDLPGEALPMLLEALLAAGALDAWASPVLMKKGRPGLLLEALCAPEAREAVGEALLRHGGTFGYRWSATPREVCARSFETVQTPWGAVRVKIAERHGATLHAAPEHEDCAALARASGRSLAEVRAAAIAAWHTSVDAADAGT
jgi:uncharacterized protein (TIGR00299 family) protein